MKKIFLFLLIIISCDVPTFEADNSFDPQNPSYVPPVVTIKSGPQSDETVSTSSVAFTWEGNTDGMFFRYFFDGRLIEDWSDINSALIENVDEGDHFFGVQGKYPTGDATDTVRVNFKVDAVKGPSLLFYPRKAIAPIGGQLVFEVLAEEVEGLAASSFTLLYKNQSIKIDSVIKGNFIAGYSSSIFYSDIIPSGEINIISALLGDNSPVFSGTTSIAKIYLTVQSDGLSEISFKGDQTFRDLDNNSININSAIGGIIDQK